MFRISIDLAGLTWGELRRFVRLADRAGIEDSAEVYVAFESDCCFTATGFEISTPAAAIEP